MPLFSVMVSVRVVDGVSVLVSLMVSVCVGVGDGDGVGDLLRTFRFSGGKNLLLLGEEQPVSAPLVSVRVGSRRLYRRFVSFRYYLV